MGLPERGIYWKSPKGKCGEFGKKENAEYKLKAT